MSGDQNERPFKTDEDEVRYRFQDDEYYQSPPPVPTESFRNKDQFPDEIILKNRKQLGQLSLGLKIYAAINALIYCFPLIHLTIGIMMVTGNFASHGDENLLFLGVFFIFIALVIILFGWGLSIVNLFVAKYLKEQRNYTFCFVVSCVNCAFFPFGTIAGVFGLVLLLQDSVKHLFKKQELSN